jgi:hypothetical protein
VRFRLLVAVMVAGLLSVTGIASAQDTTTGSYTTSVPSATQPTSAQGKTTKTPTVASEQSNAAPAVAAQPAGSAPSNLAFTGAEPIAFILFGFALAGTAVMLLVRDRRRTSQDR